MTNKQIEYLRLYDSGYSINAIAEMKGRNPSTIFRTIQRATAILCPFSNDCTKCPLPDCAIKSEYAFLLNRHKGDFHDRRDFEQVVRCKDCELCEKKDIWGTGKITYECSRTDQDMGPDGFCSFGRELNWKNRAKN